MSEQLGLNMPKPPEPKASAVAPGSTTHVIHLPASFHALTESIFGSQGLLAVFLTVAASVMILRKRFAQDSNEIAKARAETSLVESLVHQAEVYKEDARRAWGQRTNDAEQIARQQMQIAYLQQALGAMRAVLEEVAPDKAKMLQSIPAESGELNGSSIIIPNER